MVVEVLDDHVDPEAFPPGVDIRRASNGRMELVSHVIANDPVDALSRVEYLIDSQPLTYATIRVSPLDEDEGPLPVLVTVPEAALRLGVSQQRVRQLIESPHGLYATKVGRDWLMREIDIERRRERMAARREARRTWKESTA